MIDLRSDTVTKPSNEMRRVVYEAEVGDDVYGEDPTVQRLEELAAKRVGKEAAMFVTSGTQGNQIAVLTHCRPGDEIILEENAHMYIYEGAAVSALAGVQSRPLQSVKGAMDPADIQAAIRIQDIHFPETSLICLENTHNKAGGAVVPIENMKAIHQVALAANIPVHLDGARIFNAAIATGNPITDFTSNVDTVQFCLSKGLGAPVGSILAGSASFIAQAKKWRKRLGGGLRQAGIIAAPGIMALQDNVDRLADDHDNAKLLADGLRDIKGLRVVNTVETNMVLIDVSKTKYTENTLVAVLKKEGVLVGAYGTNYIRLVTHLDVSKQDIKQALAIIKRVLS